MVARRCPLELSRLALIWFSRTADPTGRNDEATFRWSLLNPCVLEDLASHAINRLELPRPVKIGLGGIGANSLG